jgi:peptide/nickel transport system permease protein
VHFIPGNPITILLGPRANPALIAQVNRQMDLGKSIPTQIVDFIGNALQGNLGTDFLSQEPVTSLIGAALPHTLILAAASCWPSRWAFRSASSARGARTRGPIG